MDKKANLKLLAAQMACYVVIMAVNWIVFTLVGLSLNLKSNMILISGLLPKWGFSGTM